MNTQHILAPAVGLKVLGVERTRAQWVISATSLGGGSCPSCGVQSNARHSINWRRLQDLPVQGISVIIRLRVARLRCRNSDCQRQIFGERVSGVAEPRLRRHAACWISFICSGTPRAEAGSESMQSRGGLILWLGFRIEIDGREVGIVSPKRDFEGAIQQCGTEATSRRSPRLCMLSRDRGRTRRNEIPPVARRSSGSDLAVVPEIDHRVGEGLERVVHPADAFEAQQ
jgi:transposase